MKAKPIRVVDSSPRRRLVIFAPTAAGVLGAAGLIVGYLAPLIVNPDATAGPLTGIIITGPVWAAIGLVFGVIAAGRKLATRSFYTGLTLLFLLAAASTIYINFPEDRFEGEIVDGQIVSCRSAEALVPAAIERWRAMEHGHESEMRPSWPDDIPRMLKNDAGVVVTFQTVATTQLYESRKPWAAGKRITKRSKGGGQQDFFVDYAGNDCAAYAAGAPGKFSVEWRASPVSPPDVLPSFLGLRVLQPTR